MRDPRTPSRHAVALQWMLTAWAIRKHATVIVADRDETAELARLREETKARELVCPTCRESLTLRAGEQRRPHFAHRILANCPQANVSLAVLESRWLLYTFFKERIERGKLTGPVELEPAIPDLPSGSRVDLILRRGMKKPIGVVILETALKPELRLILPSALQQNQMIFRPVFLASTLKRMKDDAQQYLLNTTQRDLMQKSPFGLSEDHYGPRYALHFVDHDRAIWTSLRGLRLEHAPQVYLAESVRESSMSTLLWSNKHAEWTHPEEPEVKEVRNEPVLRNSPQQSNRLVTAPHIGIPAAPRQFQPPAWMIEGLVCVACGTLTHTENWQTAQPLKGRCICRSCFAAGKRLDA